MEQQAERRVCIGILAHVDAGKTTLSESILYLSGNIRKPGRVDHGDAFLDTYALERSRGITIFSKQAVFVLEESRAAGQTGAGTGNRAAGQNGAGTGNRAAGQDRAGTESRAAGQDRVGRENRADGGGEVRVTLLDTPGHVDFSAEMERTLQVLDYAVLVINGADGVQAHTRTLWGLLRKYRIPVFLFVNKMDQPGTDRERLLAELKSVLDDACVEFAGEDAETFLENLATCDEETLNEYLETGAVCRETIVRLIAARKVFPCYFGSALKVTGVQELLDGIRVYARCWSEGRREAVPGLDEDGNEEEKKQKSNIGNEFRARIYKISRDPQGNRLTHLKVTGGVLRVRDTLRGEETAEGTWEEKVNQIRIYSGERFEAVPQAEAGTICAVTGLSRTYPGEGLGAEPHGKTPVLEPVLNYRVILPEGCDAHTMLRGLRQLEEEEPMLRVVWNEELGEIHAQVMGEVQIEILQSLILERFGVSVTFGTGNIVYKETIGTMAEGVGHFEPLRHYAEVHLLLEPGERGSGITVGTVCSEDSLDRNWQRLILTHLLERTHRGVLTGAPLTDVRITLLAGRAHLKHTEGGDFRQATYRAVRQGLMQAESILLEPYYEFQLEIPAEAVGRALTDIQRMEGNFQPPETEGDLTVITGSAPVAAMRDYQLEVSTYTKGRGRLSCTFRGYAPCHNAEEVIGDALYDPERDLDNPASSVFCAHGAGFNVPWDQVPDHMHIESQLGKVIAAREAAQAAALREQADAGNVGGPGLGDADSGAGAATSKKAGAMSGNRLSYNPREEKELEEIFIRTYGKVERQPLPASRTVTVREDRAGRKKEAPLREYLLVDGYNVIFAWEELKELARDNIEGARGRLMDILSNYQGFKKCTVILVFDAYKVQGDVMEIQKYHNIYVVYTKEAETADQYIEKVVHEIGHRYHVTVVTSDGVEQVVTLGQGGTLLSSREFREEVSAVNRQIQAEIAARRRSGKNYLFNHLDDELAAQMEEVRLGKKDLDGTKSVEPTGARGADQGARNRPDEARADGKRGMNPGAQKQTKADRKRRMDSMELDRKRGTNGAEATGERGMNGAEADRKHGNNRGAQGKPRRKPK